MYLHRRKKDGIQKSEPPEKQDRALLPPGYPHGNQIPFDEGMLWTPGRDRTKK